ncbi:MAG: HD domain-containing protein [Anaerolineales bacterium]
MVKERALPLFEEETPAIPADLKPEISPYIAITGHVELTQLEKELVDHPDFQRLRRLKQLGTSYLVFPSAVHTRFDHSLGCLSRLNEMIVSIRTNPASEGKQNHISEDEERLTRLVALLHDVGNLPFGHTLEDETRVIKENQDSRDRYLRILDKTKEGGLGEILVRYLGSRGFEQLMEFLTTSEKDVHNLKEKAFVTDLVKNTLCADLLDYLWRDPYFSGLPYRVGDDFLRYLYLDDVVNETGEVARRPIVRVWKEESQRHRRDTLRELIDLLHLRYTLGETIYFHHAKLASGAMLGRAVYEALTFPNGKKPLSVELLLQMGDEDLLRHIIEFENGISSMLGEMIWNRKIYKRGWSYDASRNEAGRWNPKKELLVYRDPEKRILMEKELADRAGLKNGEVLLYCPDPKMALKAAKMWILWRGKETLMENVDDEPSKHRIESIQESHSALWTFWVFVHPDVSAEKLEELKIWCEEFRTGEIPTEAVDNEILKKAVAAQLTAEDTAIVTKKLQAALVEGKGTRSTGTRYNLMKFIDDEIKDQSKRRKKPRT